MTWLAWATTRDSRQFRNQQFSRVRYSPFSVLTENYHTNVWTNKVEPCFPFSRTLVAMYNRPTDSFPWPLYVSYCAFLFTRHTPVTGAQWPADYTNCVFSYKSPILKFGVVCAPTSFLKFLKKGQVPQQRVRNNSNRKHPHFQIPDRSRCNFFDLLNLQNLSTSVITDEPSRTPKILF